MNKKNLLIIIPARKSSTNIKNKNLIKIDNKPLIWFSISFAKKIKKNNDEIFCSTNSKKIKKTCEKYGLNVPALRPDNLSQKLSRDIGYVNHALNYFSKKQQYFKYGLILRPTSPIRDLNTIKKAYKLFKVSKHDSMRAIVKLNISCFKMWFKNKNNQISSIMKSNIYEHYNAPRQILQNTYYQTGNFEFFKINYKNKLISISGNKIYGFVTDNKYSHDIDGMSDIKKLKLLFKN